MKLIITGGRQADSKLSYFNKEWNNGIEGVIFEYDPKKNLIEEKISYKTPLENRPIDNYSISFKSGSIHNNKLYVTTLTEILIFDLPEYKLVDIISLNIFNDLHHVIYHEENLFIVITGLDLVVKFSLNEKKIKTFYNCYPEINTWERFDKNKDYRKINTTKPHLSHPNHVSIFQDKVLVTRYKQQDALIFSMEGKVLDKINLNKGIPHDGAIFNESFIYTTVNGNIIEVNKSDFSIKKITDLNFHSKDGRSLGWCRGYQKLESLNYVGYSRIRPTKFVENIKWLGSKLTDKVKLKMPTRIECYNENYSKIKNTIDLESYKMNWVFSILKY